MTHSALARVSPAEIQRLDPQTTLARYVPTEHHGEFAPIVNQAIRRGDAAALVQVIQQFSAVVEQVHDNTNRLNQCEAWAQGVNSKLAILDQQVSALQAQPVHERQPTVQNISYTWNIDASDRSQKTTESHSYSWGASYVLLAGAVLALLLAVASSVRVETYRIQPTGYEIVPQ